MDQDTQESLRGLPGNGATAPSRKLIAAMQISTAVVGAVVLWCAAWLMLENATLRRDVAWHLTLPTLFVSIIGLLIYRENRKWWQPSGELKKMIVGCRAGETPIDELKNVGRGMADLAEAVQSLLRDLRQQRKLAAELEAELGQRVASRTSALERQMSSLRTQATRDALTGLFNRRMLEECLPKLAQQCRNAGGELSILAIDVDHFKPLNDTLGHAAGDDFLRSIGQILRSGVRECDVAVRCGGDEFIVLLPNCPLTAAKSLAERLTAMVASMAKTIKSPLPPGLSIGAASIKPMASCSASIESTVSDLLESADKQLYLTKAARKRRAA